MDHLEAVVEIKNVVSPEFMDKIIPLINKKATKQLPISSGVDKNIRNVKGYPLNYLTPTDTFYWNFIKKEVEKLFIFYTSKFPQIMKNHIINQIDLLKYLPGGKYEIHTDHHPTSARNLSIIINLNNEYEGGDLIFTDQKNKEIKRLKLSKGSIVFFPSNFMYPHKIQPITKGTRYSIVAWLQ
jgi:predicted 2-oxoglutarate/Fe(II)-dependent dioxygenase YbiX|tara:strand:+ start:508 stop:1056 length:549 start_codon:yes stop_codon:yes gene_type:complete